MNLIDKRREGKISLADAKISLADVQIRFKSNPGEMENRKYR